MLSRLQEQLLDWARALRYGMVGISTAALYFVLINLCAKPIGWLSPFAANVLALTISVSASYLGHHAFTFRKSGQHQLYMRRFGIVTAGIFVIVSVLAWVGDEVFHLPALAISIMVSLAYPVLSYILHSLWTFAEAHQRRLVQAPRTLDETR
jgi:putative flippase GtrA